LHEDILILKYENTLLEIAIQPLQLLTTKNE